MINKIKLFTPGWWIVHTLALLFFLWLGYAVRF